MVRLMRWDRHSLMAFAGIAALVIGGALLLADPGAVFVPIIGMVAGIAAVARASHEPSQPENGRTGTAPGPGGMARQYQPHWVNSGPGNHRLVAGPGFAPDKWRPQIEPAATRLRSRKEDTRSKEKFSTARQSTARSIQQPKI
jgi:hypothetical protein